MSKWDEIYGPATPIASLEARIEKLERAMDDYKIVIEDLFDIAEKLNETMATLGIYLGNEE